MSENKIKSEQATLLGLLSKVLFKADYTPVQDVKWMKVCEESYMQSVSVECYFAAKGYLPTDGRATKLWSEIALGGLKNNRRVFSGHDFVHKLLTDAGIKYCIIKGCSSAFYYPEGAFRNMGDVDFLVNKADMERASEILKGAGFENSETGSDCHTVFKKDKLRLEMHHTPSGIPDGKIGETVRSYLDDIFEKSEKVTLDDTEFVKPSDFHHGLIIILHTVHHLLFEGVGLRHLCDLAVFMNSFSDEEFDSMFREKLTEVGLWNFARTVGAASVRYLKMPYHSWIGDVDEGLCFALISDIFSGGNFGKKEQDKVYIGRAISDRKSGKVSRISFLQIISSMEKTAQGEFPSLEKHPILRPFGFFMLAFRYLLRSVTGKRRKISVLLKSYAKRKKLYRGLMLYDINKK